jgi:hypothetical protein
MSLLCEMAAPFVAHSAVEGVVVARPFRGHTEACLRCRSRHSAMVRTARELRDLAGKQSPAPVDLEWRVMSSLEGELAISRSWRKPVALVAAVVSMAAAIVIWRLRPRTSG